MINVKRPQKGQKVLQSLYDSVVSIIDYLPTLTVRGDNYSTYVEHASNGTIIHSKQSTSPDQAGGKTYYAGSGLTLSGNIFNNAHTSGRFIQITSGNAINCTLSGGRDIQITQGGIINYIGEGGGGASGYTYVGDGDLGSGHIFVDYSYTNPVICSNLYWISDLNNLPFVQSASIVMPNSLTACNNTVDISQVGQIYSNHFLQTKDILNDGVGTKVNLTWIRNPFGDQDPDGTNGIVQGLQVDLTLSGGRYTDVILHKHVYGAYDPDTGTRYDPPTESRVDCLLTGTYDRYPHTSGFIDIVPVEMEDGKTWGVISTNLHAGSGIAIDPQTGEITCTGGGGGTTIIASGLQYPNYSALYNDNNGNVSGIGISFILPVSAGQEYKYYTDARDEDEEHEGTYIEHAFATYAPAEGETGDSRRAIANGVEFVPSANGYIRISVFDDGKHQGKCLRFYKGGDTDYEFATPLYRFHGFTNYQAGAGIAINSGIISCMLQTNAGLSGLTSTALTTNTYPPVTTGIAIGLSTAWAQDLAKINEHTLAANKNKVLSSNNYGNLVWATNVEPGDPDTNTEYSNGRFINISTTKDANDKYPISCTLSCLTELYNDPVTEERNHFVQSRDLLYNKGINAIITPHSSYINYDEQGNPVWYEDGIQVDCVITGGRFIEVNSHWQNSGGTTPEEIEPDDHTVNCLLSGASGIVMDEETNLVSLSADFYNALTTILARPSAGNFVLGSLDGTLTWLSTCVCDEVNNG